VIGKARPDGRAPASRAARKLYARLGLTADASDSDVEKARKELVDFLEGAPEGARRWARNEIAAVNEAHAALTGSAPRGGTGRAAGLKRLGVGIAALAVTVGVVVAVYNAGDSQDGSGSEQTAAAEASELSSSDRARIAQLMEKVEQNPKDAASLMALGDIYFEAGDYNHAGSWMEEAVAAQPKNVKARLALGAAKFNLGETSDAREQWERVIAIDAKNVEAYYDLGFLYLSENPPQTKKAKQLWRKVLEIAPPNSDVAKSVSTHLDGLEKAEESGSTAGSQG
jgi:cytochrome c-type biogenesis protein CcmH/NrfG